MIQESRLKVIEDNSEEEQIAENSEEI